MRTVLPLIACWALALPLCAAPARAGGWLLQGGSWSWQRELIPLLCQGAPGGEALATSPGPTGTTGAWRGYLQLAQGAREAGLWLFRDAAGTTGLRVSLGEDGFALRRADGRTVWADAAMPWYPYHAYLLELVVERGRVRAQAFEADGRTLASQSPWLAVRPQTVSQPTALCFYTREAVARFWGARRAEAPLSPVVEDAPNKRRLQTGPGAPWAVVGNGAWQWTGADRQRLRQRATVERSSALSRENRGALRGCECRLSVSPGSGGAGMLLQADEQAGSGLLAWLGGNHGAGSLMLYRLPLDCLWSGEQGNWHYDTEYVLRAETRLSGEEGEARAQLLAADGRTSLQDTGWVKVGRETAAREGSLGFMTWLGPAEFWGFGGSADSAAPAAAGTPPAALSPPWVTLGDGAWQWTDSTRTALRQTASPARALALSTAQDGLMGTWHCRCTPAPGASAGLAFQASRGGTEGFACLLTPGGLRLETLAGKTLWTDTALRVASGQEYLLEAEVMTDRVAVRCRAADGKATLSECPAVYVSEANNARRGYLGALCRAGQAAFRDWGYAPEAK